MPPPRWEPTTEDLGVIRAHNDEAAARLIGRDAATIKRVRVEHGIPNPFHQRRGARPVEPEPEPDLPQRPSGVWELPEWVAFEDNLWGAMERLQQEILNLDTQLAEVEIEIEDTKPVMLLWISDAHVGHIKCDMAQLRRDLETVRNTDGVHVLLGGDLIDNVVTSVTSRGMHMEQLAPVRVQKELADRMVMYLDTKVRAMLLGNHEKWSITSDDFDVIAYLAKKLKCPYLGEQGKITVRLGRQVYTGNLAHKFRMRSSFNLTHQAKRLEDFAGDADFTFVGHTHEYAGESTVRRGQKKFYGQAGSYLRSTRYGEGLGFTGTTAEMPCVILWPDRREFLGFADAFAHGIPYLKLLRA